MKAGEQLTFVVGTGNGLCTCEGAAFEYIFNLEFEIRKAGVRDNARIVMLTNEAELGDFGVDSMQLKRGGYLILSKVFAESLFVEIQDRINAEFSWSPFVHPQDVHVIVSGGKVTLTGTVQTFRERRAAGDSALEAGAVSVDNELKVG